MEVDDDVRRWLDGMDPFEVVVIFSERESLVDLSAVEVLGHPEGVEFVRIPWE